MREHSPHLPSPPLPRRSTDLCSHRISYRPSHIPSSSLTTSPPPHSNSDLVDLYNLEGIFNLAVVFYLVLVPPIAIDSRSDFSLVLNLFSSQTTTRTCRSRTHGTLLRCSVSSPRASLGARRLPSLSKSEGWLSPRRLTVPRRLP